MLERLADIPAETWSTFVEMAPYLLFGFLVAGILSVFISPALVERHLGGRGVIRQVVKGSVFGVPLPLCSCGVIPVAASLRAHGANRAATVSFLISTPQTGVDSIFVTFSLLGPVWAVVRPVVAFATGILGGILTGIFAPDTGSPSNGVGAEDESRTHDGCKDGRCGGNERSRLSRVLSYAFGVLPRDIARPLIVGVVIAGAVSALVPEGSLARTGLFGGGIIPILLMMGVGIPIYVCATSSVPVAAALVTAGVSPGAVLAFLMTGPATNAATIATVWKVMGRKTAVIYLLTVAGSAIASGLMLNYLFEVSGAPVIERSMWMLPEWFKVASAFALLGVLGYALLSPPACELPDHDHGGTAGGAEDEEEISFTVEGMHCGNCARVVRQNLQEIPGVISVQVSLEEKRAVVSGRGIEKSAIRDKIRELGYTVVE